MSKNLEIGDNKITSNFDYRRRNINQLYIMVSNHLIKIGISSDVGKRLKSLNSRLKIEDKFKILKVKFYSSYFETRNAEKRLHEKYKYANVRTEYSGAKTECFSKDILCCVLEDIEEDGATYSFDPFIYVSKSDAEKVTGITCVQVYKLLGRNCVTPKVVDLCLKNIAANIVMSRGRRIFYNTVILNNLAPSTSCTTKLLEILNWGRFKSLLPKQNLDLGAVKFTSLNNPPNFLRRYHNVTKGYLTSIESLWDRSLNQYTNTSYFKEIQSFVFGKDGCEYIGDTSNLKLEYEIN